MNKRVFLIVLDSFGIGNAPDAQAFGDGGANTLASVCRSAAFAAPNLTELGLFNIDGTDNARGVSRPLARYARLAEASRGKDTTVGHFELAGVISQHPFPTYPQGFPPEIISRFESAAGRRTLCNRPYSGTQVICDYGERHMRTGELIVYTSADSVFQIAAHESVVPLTELYRCCECARRILTGKNGVARVIARPFRGTPGNFTRTANRRDFSLPAPHETLLDIMQKAGLDTIGVGKINDIFAGRGISESVEAHGNAEGIEKTLELLGRDFNGLAFVNLVDFDMLYGHRRDIDGYAAALSRFDRALGEMMSLARKSDRIIITADHGCDPAYSGTDHTRECVPLLIYGAKPENLGTVFSFASLARGIGDYFGLDTAALDGKTFSLA